jgi:transposase-like protein
VVAERLQAGASIEAIAREVGRHPSSVAYWVHKHGLTSTHAARHAARGPIERDLLVEIVACELSIRDMADVFERSPTTIRHWLRRHQLSAGSRNATPPCSSITSTQPRSRSPSAARV